MSFDLSGMHLDDFRELFSDSRPEPENSLFQQITNSLNADGELPRDFQLPAPKHAEGSVSFVDGARDAMLIYHSVKEAEPPQQSAALLDTVIDAVKRHACNDALLKIYALTDGCSVLTLRKMILSRFTRYLGEAAAGADGIVFETSGVSELMHECLRGYDAEVVKFGLVLCELNTEEKHIPKEMIRVLSRCNEFTLFCLYNMQGWINANSEIFYTAMHVHGWGRIHAVDMISPRTEQIRTWLLMNGCHNDIMPQYSALAVYEKTGCRRILVQAVTDRQLSEIAFLLSALVAEGVSAGISAVRDADALLTDFIDQARRHSLTLGICELVLFIRMTRSDEQLRSRCDDLLGSSGCRELTARAYAEGRGEKLAEFLGMTGRRDDGE